MKAGLLALATTVLLAAPVAAAAAGEGAAASAPAGGTPAGAHGSRDLPVAGPLPFAPADVPDRVIEGSRVRASSAPPVRAARTRSYRTPDGQHVEVATSAAYPEDDIADRALVDFLATRVHGAELGSIRLFVGKPAEVNELCGGGDVVACYATAEQRMYVPGEDTAGIPTEYVITHEYGHHLASARRNDPWDALDWGPKRWSSEVGVCAAVKRGVLWPGDQGRHYASDPGEGFADGYAHLHYPDAPWQYNPFMQPDARIFDAIRRDVEDPWVGPETRIVRGSARLRLALDGEVSLRMAAPRRARYELTLRTPGWTERRVVRGGGRIGLDVCQPGASGPLELTLAMRPIDGAAPAKLIVRYPG